MFLFAELFVSEHLLTSNKNNLGFGVFHGPVPASVHDWVKQGRHRRAGDSPQVAQGRSVGLDGARGQKPWWDKVWGGRLRRTDAAPSRQSPFGLGPRQGPHHSPQEHWPW